MYNLLSKPRASHLTSHLSTKSTVLKMEEAAQMLMALLEASSKAGKTTPRKFDGAKKDCIPREEFLKQVKAKKEAAEKQTTTTKRKWLSKEDFEAQLKK